MAILWFISRRLSRRMPTWAFACPFIHIVSGFPVALIALMTMIPVQAQTTAYSATYTVTFQGNWTTDSTPDGVASNAHFTTLVGAVHNDMATFWESGGMATPGVEGVAELGSTRGFKSEVAAAGANASLVEESIGRSPTVTATFDIEVTTDRPLFTLLSMIGPSPDWFVGVAGLSLLDAQGQWLSEHQVDLFPYDAGTEDGSEFSIDNDATSPRGTIASIRGTGKFSDVPMAMLSFDLQGTTESNVAPAFTGPASFSVPENGVAAGTVQAIDSDGADSVTGYAIAGGADGALFSIASMGALTFRAAPSYEDPQDADENNRYEVSVRATSGTGAREMTAERTIAVTVTDVSGEVPSAPSAPNVTAVSATMLRASWTAPSNDGPGIDDYDYRYRERGLQHWTEVTNILITDRSTTIGNLSDGTGYEVQIRATNAEGTGGWSASGTGMTQVGAPDRVTGVSVAEEVERLAVSWNEVAEASGYKVQWKSGGQDYNDSDRQHLVSDGATTGHTISNLTAGVEYTVRVIATRDHAADGPASAEVTGTPLSPPPVSTIASGPELPIEVALSGNYPNPFNPETTIRYALPQAGQVHLAVYDLLGHEVAILVDRSKPAGNHTVRFGAGNLPSGLYVYRLHAGDETIVRTMMLVK